MKNIVIHIGPDKTGNNTLQMFLSSNRDELLKSNILYPKLKNGWNIHHELLARNLKKNRGANTRFVWDILFKQIEQANFIDTIILSSEAFHRLNLAEIAQLNKKFKQYSVKIIFYARRQDVRMELLYTQGINSIVHVPMGTIEEFLIKNRSNNDYYKILQPWSDIFGKENILVKVLESEQISDLTLNFLNIVGIKNYGNFIETQYINEKTGVKSLIIHKLLQDIFNNAKVQLHKIFIDKYGMEGLKRINKLHHEVKNGISRFVSENMEELYDYHLIPYDDSLKILDYFKESNRLIARKYLNRDKLFYEAPLFYEHHELDANLISPKEWSRLAEFLLQDEIMKENIKELWNLAEFSDSLINKDMIIRDPVKRASSILLTKLSSIIHHLRSS